ncbi:50S ribosomal protein L11 [Candidatus Peribacteria bacterium RIFCSPLOWO2_02_FULL_55_36]|nr:MAG: 50S ribosomal protein L11 [Candidatus Peribacteria bacterium RIFCSPHIGHO2_01_FULL_54_22]OGJ62421.1 MAG: 50S ribosomal protein L11 [Candidatus Peribacteria bacterium RIFCSPHIGHO2_02_FULL_55_24]OGJ63997.1 MAG: 50S ribosomal protein L11 [Candidatus Peribacteria bacterium RIFCSPHIGHO2_12_FULL_54_10]OGJ68792.1 MAG: 50S ribosomal protein L11 [Candidatus Peribacteria bacterium RIFCSPLOWO2_01_FULL_54_110]OGJ69326.1 MAG: 50S ribosomal protein L11 [Candidatus Peribacteria bacterium RIFCSPLOWO2_02
MAKVIKKVIKVQAKGGQATPAPPLGPVLGQAGVDIASFCNQFNQKTKDRMGQIVPIVLTVFEDRSFTFIMKQPPASALIMERAKIEKGSGDPKKTPVGSITQNDVRDIARTKLQDLNTTSLESAMRTIEGAARSMGVSIEK